MQFIINNIPTWVGIFLCVGLSVFVCKLINNKYKETNSVQLLQYKPTVWTSFGILGTFGSILYCLWVRDIDYSDVGQLVTNIVPAFATSFIGVGASIFSSYRVKKAIAENEKKDEDAYKSKTSDSPEIVLHSILQAINSQTTSLKSVVEKEIKGMKEDLISNLTGNEASIKCVLDNQQKLLNSIVDNTSNLQKDMSKSFEESAKNIASMYDNTKNHNKDIKDKIGTIVDNLTKFFNDVSENAAKRISELTESHMKNVDDLMIKHKEAFNKYNEELAKTTQDNIKLHQESLKGYHDGILKDVQTEYEQAKTDMSQLLSGMNKRIQEEDELLKTITETLKTNIEQSGKTIQDAIAPLSNSVADSVKKNVETGFEALNGKYNSWATTITTMITNDVAELKKKIAENEEKSVDDLTRQFNNELKTTIETLNKSVAQLSSALTSEKDKVNFIEDSLKHLIDKDADLRKALQDSSKVINDANSLSQTVAGDVASTKQSLESLRVEFVKLNNQFKSLTNHKSVKVINGIKTCPNCSEKNEADSDYCSACGNPI